MLILRLSGHRQRGRSPSLWGSQELHSTVGEGHCQRLQGSDRPRLVNRVRIIIVISMVA